MLYRNGANKDGERILEVIGTVLNEYGLSVSKDGVDRDVLDINKFYFENNGWFQVVENNGEIIGTVGIYRISNSECELRKMYLLSDFQGEGIGKRLMENAITKAKELGYNKITLQTNSVLKKAIQLYYKYGFKSNCNGEIGCRCDMAMIKEI